MHPYRYPYNKMHQDIEDMNSSDYGHPGHKYMMSGISITTHVTPF